MCLRLGLVALVLLSASLPGPTHAQDEPGAGGSDRGVQEEPGAEESAASDPTALDEPSVTPEPLDPLEPELSPDIEDLVITGTKSDAPVTDTPTSTVGYQQSDLDALGVGDVTDLAKTTPSLEINTTSGSTPTFFIRGVGLNDFGANATGAVAIYKDGAPINAPALQLGLLYDAQVTVLRGPQGTGNWRNASAGAISFTPALPDWNLESSLRFDAGNYGLLDVEGLLSGPISEELAGRVAFRIQGRDPFVNNQCGGLAEPTRGACGANMGTNFSPLYVPAGLPNEVNDEGEWGARALLRFQPGAGDTDWVLNVHGGQVDQQARLGQVIGVQQSANGPLTRSRYIDPAIEAIHAQSKLLYPGDNVAANSATLAAVTDDIALADPFDNAYNLVGDERLTTYGATLNGTAVLGDFDLRLVTDGERWTRDRLDDLDFSPDTVIHRDADDDGWQVTQSAEVGSELDRLPLRWRAGAYYLYEELGSETLFDYSINPAFIQKVAQVWSQETHSLGVYAGLEYDLTTQLVLEGGVRYNWERKDFRIQVERYIGAPNFNTSPSEDQQAWHAPTGGLSLTYTPIDELSTYAKYTRGWKPGHFNAAILENADSAGVLAPDVTFAEPETIDAFEVGFDWRLFDGLADLHAAGFYYLYDDYQVFVFQTIAGAPPQFEIINANDSVVYGVEIDLYAEPLRDLLPEEWGRLFLEARGGWLESEFKDFVRRRDTIVGGALITDYVDFTGNPLPNTPRFKLSGSASYELEIGGFGTLVPRYDFSYTDDIYFDPSEGRGTPPVGTRMPLSDFAIGQRAYWLHNLRLGYRLPWYEIEIAGWVRNVTDERYKTFVADGSDAIRSLLNYVGDPRTYGASIRVSY